MTVVSGASSAVVKSALVSEIRERAKANPWLMQTIVVSSGASRQEFAAELVQGGALPGVKVVALWRLAQEVVDCQIKSITSERTPHALSVLHADPLLEEGAPDSGFSSALGDLLSAGLDESLMPALAKALDSVSLTAWPICEKFSVACKEVLGSAGVREQDHVLAQAVRTVRAEPDGSRSDVHLYGFAGATGLATDLLAAFVGRGATLWLEVHEGDAARLPIAAARRHVTAFAQRVAREGAAPRRLSDSGAAQPAWDCFTAPDATTEAEEVALRVHALLQAGTASQRIAVILTDYGAGIETCALALRALAIPFHSRHSFAVTPLRRAALMLARTLRNGASAHPVPDVLRIEAEVLNIAAPASLVAMGEVREWVRRLAAWCHGRAQPEPPEVEGIHTATGGRDLEAPGLAALSERLSAIADELNGATGSFRAIACTRWLARELEALEDFACKNLDAPSGVQVLSTAHARGLTFDHAFLVGAGRGFWPRRKNHGAVLPLAARVAAQQVLPDLASEDGSDELAHQFIQMLHLAPKITISWPRGGGKERGGAAPWVLSALALSENALTDKSLRANTKARLESALKRHKGLGVDAAVVLAGLSGKAAEQAGLLARSGVERAAAEERVGLLECFEGRGAWEHRKQLSPWHGRGVALWGPQRVRGSAASPAQDKSDSSTSESAVSPTLLEMLASCAWKRFLERELALNGSEDPMEARWKVSPMDRGSLVHYALESLVAEVLGNSAGVSVEALREYATGPRIDACVGRAFERLCTEKRSKSRMQWATSPLICARELTEAIFGVNKALELLSLHDVTFVVAAEKSYPVVIGELKVVFKADLEARISGQRVFVDWKSSRKPAELGSVKKVRHFDHGTKLQAAIYSTYAPGDGLATGPGVYAYVSTDFSRASDRWQECSAGDAGDRFAPTMHALQEMLKGSLAPPRVAKGVDGDAEGEACRFCDLSRVCVLGDSRQRGLLTESARHDEVLGAWWKLAGSAKQGASDA